MSAARSFVRGVVGAAAVLALVLGAGGCSQAPLDTTGLILAGPDGSANACPDGYVARWGHCCPANSAADMCPAMVTRDVTGTQYPPENNVCPHDYELRFGKCCPADAGSECPPGELGAPCTTSDQCHRPANGNVNLAPVCLTPASFHMSTFPLPFQAPDGYCSVNNCASDADCGPEGMCLRYGTFNSCVRACSAGGGDGGTTLSCPGTANHLSCMTWKPQLAAFAFHFCFPDCTMSPPNVPNADAGTTGDGGAVDYGRSVCQMDWQCYADIHQCALHCGSPNDNFMCQIAPRANYTSCDVDAGHCAY